MTSEKLRDNVHIIAAALLLFAVLGTYLLGSIPKRELLVVTSELTPANVHSREAAFAFERQQRIYLDAVMTAESAIVREADEPGRIWLSELEKIAGNRRLPNSIQQEAQQLYVRCASYIPRARKTYAALADESDGAAAKAQQLAEEGKQLRYDLQQLHKRIDRAISAGLARVETAEKLVRVAEVVILVLSVGLLYVLLRNLVTKPLERQVEERTQSLLEQNQYVEAVFQAIPTGVIIAREGDHEIVDANPAACEMIGAQLEQIKESRCIDDFCPRQLDQCPGANGESIGNLETTMKRLDGSEFSVLRTVAGVRLNGEPCLLAAFVDISEIKELRRAIEEHERQALQQEKMASVGQLAAGVAHEINNPIGFVKSNIGTLADYISTMRHLLEMYDKAVEAPDLLSQHLSRIQDVKDDEDMDFILEDLDTLLSESADGLVRVQDIVKNLKDFARVDEAELKEADLNECIESTLKIVWNELKYNCEVSKDLGEIPMLMCNPGQLNQVFMNLLVNASHAIADRGEIRIRTWADDAEVCVAISDTGCGIAEDDLGRLFDPFFTTKEIGKGTGLGLSISHGIIERHNGHIEVESTLGKGTTFTIHLPIDAAACTAPAT